MLLSAPAGIIGGLGIVWMGYMLAHITAHRVSAAHVEAGLRHARGGRAAAVAFGSAAMLLPTGGAPARLHTDLVAGGQVRLQPALLVGLGLAGAELSTVAAITLGAARPAALLLGLIVLGGSGAISILARRSAAISAVARWVAGWSAVVVGAHLATSGFALLPGMLPSMGSNTLWSRGLAAVLFGAGLTFTLGNGALVAAVAVAATAGGVIGAPLAAACLVGVRVGTGCAPLTQLARSTGDARRAALGSAALAFFQGGMGLLVLAIGLPMLTNTSPAPVGPALALFGFEVAFLVGSTLACLPFLAPLVAALDDRVDEGKSDGPFTTGLSPVAALSLHDQSLELKRLARHQAKAILAEKGVTGFRMEVDLAAAQAMVDTSRAQAKRLLEDSLPASTAAAVLAARELELLPDLIAQLAELEHDRLGWLIAAHDRLAVRLRDAEFTCLHLIQDMLGAGADPGGHADHAALVLDQKLLDVEQETMAAVAVGRLEPDRALAVIWRAGRLRRLAQVVVESVEPRAAEGKRDAA
ncbi:MAG: hypothetical protein O2816_05635 [Planctomycetota bacterium]|nr:hypothetical protein [Planctomycetota bacterium]